MALTLTYVVKVIILDNIQMILAVVY